MVSANKLVVLSALLLAGVGCATQKSVDDLNARVTKLESKRAEDKANLRSAIDSADGDRINCRAIAEKRLNSWLQNNGTPVKGKPGIYNASVDGIKQAQAAEDRADGDCQKEYEDAVQAAKLKYSE
jgi:outer membrane murein-binding lipoprotein Lpp